MSSNKCHHRSERDQGIRLTEQGGKTKVQGGENKIPAMWRSGGRISVWGEQLLQKH